jgi:hypothetical protein
MTRTWKLLVWTGRKYQEANCGDSRFEARTPQDAIKKAGLNDPTYEIKYSRVGYGHFTGRIEARAPETVAAGEGRNVPLPADFVLLVAD